MRIHWFQHVPYEGLGSIADWAADRGHRLGHTALFDTQARLPEPAGVDWLIIMGGPMGVHDDARLPWLSAEKRWLRAYLAQVAERPECRVLGICLGAQLIADALGAAVTRNAVSEIGWFDVERCSAHPLTAGWPPRLTTFHWHGDTFALPSGAQHLFRSAACANQGFALGSRIVGLQFHPEMRASGIAALCAASTLPSPGASVQTADAMIADPGRARAGNRLLADLLDRMQTPIGEP